MFYYIAKKIAPERVKIIETAITEKRGNQIVRQYNKYQDHNDFVLMSSDGKANIGDIVIAIY
ncbi:hypothetical protein LCGC14_0697110 [marine sediment metagenome]|uniref:Uncharacterized protein n=1 Tax=marine sediment metagenome TaxID=412755 RepID=A0A0F9R492_9ZZZZ